jgi:hypothetical protein
MIESRRSQRRAVRQGAWIFPGGGAPSIPCAIMDLSDAGARLRVDRATQLPPRFILVMSRDGRLNRHCKTIWRNEDLLGVQFLSQESVVPKPKKPERRFEIRVPELAAEADAGTAAEAPAVGPDPRR